VNESLPRLLSFLLLIPILVFLSLSTESNAALVGTKTPGTREYIVYYEGTAQELEVYKIYGRMEGPTMMILGGIQGDEPGGFLSADLYVDMALKRGNLIIVPRANFKSIISFDRGTDGDMNRKFGDTLNVSDPDSGRIQIIKNLMSESDVFLNLHDGSGFFRDNWESSMANPDRYGQCIIADAEVYTNSSGDILRLGNVARKAVEIINRDITENNYKFSFANHDTLSPKTRHMEQRNSATFYALTKLGIPAYGIETSKQLPSLEMKIHQHNLAINAFMELYGIELEQPRINLEPPELHFLVINVNGQNRVAVADTQRLMVSPGDSLEILYVGSNYTRGISVDILDFGTLNDLRIPIKITRPTTIIARKDNILFGQVEVAFRQEDGEEQFPLVADLEGDLPIQGSAGYLPGGTHDPREIVREAKSPQVKGSLSSLNGPHDSPQQIPEETPVSSEPQEAKVSSVAKPVVEESSPTDSRRGFSLLVNGEPVTLYEGETLSVKRGAKVSLLDFANAELPEGTVMNLKGFIGRKGDTTGNDKGTICDSSKDLVARFAVDKGNLYQLGAELGPEIIYRAYLEFQAPILESVTFVLNGSEKKLNLGGRWHLPSGTKVEIKDIKLKGGLPLDSPRLTLGGRAVSADLPTIITMPNIAVSLAVFSEEELTGKVVLYP
jgi:hypothetical protein